MYSASKIALNQYEIERAMAAPLFAKGDLKTRSQHNGTLSTEQINELSIKGTTTR
jgi:hypothetical protein